MTMTTYRNQYWVTHPLTKGLDLIQPKSSVKITSHPSALAFSNVAYMNITLPFEDDPSNSEPSNPCSSIVSLILGTVVPRVDEKKERDITNTSVMTTVISEAKQNMSSQARQQGDSSSRKSNDYRKHSFTTWTCTDHVEDIECDCEDNEYRYESCECDSGGWCSSSDDEEEEEEEEEWQESEKEDTECEDDDEVVQFSSMGQVSSCSSSNPNQEVTGTCLMQHLCVPLLSHTLSFSSDESGFHERNQSDWSDESEDEDSHCPFDEDLWHKFEELGCFNDLLLPCDTLKKNLCKNVSTHTTNDTHSSIDINDSEATGSPVDSDLLSHSYTSQKKSVTFKPDHELEEVHYIIAWEYAYRSARKGPWEQYARDRDRFKNRIESVKCILEPCLVKKLENTTAQ